MAAGILPVAMNEVEVIERAQLRPDIVAFRPGDTVKVHVRVVEGNRERVQVFQGVVIGRQGGGSRETFTVRKISFGVGVERTFPVHSPSIAKLELVQRGRVRRAKLYYIRELRGKKARIRERRVDQSKLDAIDAAAAAAAEERALEETGEEADAATEAVDSGEPQAESTETPADEATAEQPLGEVEAEPEAETGELSAVNTAEEKAEA